MRINAHTHGMHAERNEEGKLVPPLVPIWQPESGDPEEFVRRSREEAGIERVVLLDPPHVVFALQEIFGDFTVPCPQVVMEKSSPDEIDGLFTAGACGIKFIAPMHPYSDSRYFPLYDAVRQHGGLAVFHTGYLLNNMFEPGCLLGRDDYIDITHMRPATLDRIARAFGDLKVLMSHFGNPWWEEAWTVIKSNENVYADMSGGTAKLKSMSMWCELFAPNGELHEASVSKLCFATDGSFNDIDSEGHKKMVGFHDRLYDALKLPEELRQKIDRENIAMLLES